MRGYTYEVNWYNGLEGSNRAESFKLKDEALNFARSRKEVITCCDVKVYRVKFGCRTQVWGRS